MHACSAAADPWVNCTMYNECYIQHTILQQLQRCNFDFIFMLSQILPYLQNSQRNTQTKTSGLSQLGKNRLPSLVPRPRAAQNRNEVDVSS